MSAGKRFCALLFLWVFGAGLFFPAPQAYGDMVARKVTRLTSAAPTEISPGKVRLMSVELTPRSANAWVSIYTSPVTTNPAHGQAVIVSEPSSATAFNGVIRTYGDGVVTEFGLGGFVVGGDATITWSPER